MVASKKDTTLKLHHIKGLSRGWSFMSRFHSRHTFAFGRKLLIYNDELGLLECSLKTGTVYSFVLGCDLLQGHRVLSLPLAHYRTSRSTLQTNSCSHRIQWQLSSGIRISVRKLLKPSTWLWLETPLRTRTLNTSCRECLLVSQVIKSSFWYLETGLLAFTCSVYKPHNWGHSLVRS